MSKVAIKGNASGTGTFTVEAPNSNTDRTLVLPDEAGTVLTSASTVATSQLGAFTSLNIQGTLSDDTQTTPETLLTIGASYNSTGVNGGAGAGARIELQVPDDETNPTTGAAIGSIKTSADDSDSSSGLAFYTSNNDTTLDERMRIDSSGNLLVGGAITGRPADVTGNISSGFRSTIGTGAGDHPVEANANGTIVGIFNRTSNDGTVILIRQDGGTEGEISVSGSTVSYNGGHLARWSQLADNTRDESIVKGTVMSNLDQMAEWTHEGVTEDNEQLNCMKVSDTEGDADVAGVFVNWDNDDDIYTNDMNIAMTGDMVIRIAQGTTVARGDLLMSAGDGTAKPQGDDIVRSKTIAKVTSTHVSHTYDDGSYLVPCVLMAC